GEAGGHGQLKSSGYLGPKKTAGALSLGARCSKPGNWTRAVYCDNEYTYSSAPLSANTDPQPPRTAHRTRIVSRRSGVKATTPKGTIQAAPLTMVHNGSQYRL